MADNERVDFRELVSHLFQTVLGTARDDELVSTFRKSWRRRFNGVLLFGMYLFVFYIVIMSLTAYQIQNRIHQNDGQDRQQSIWSVTRAVGEELRLEQELANINNKLSKATSRHAGVTVEKDNAFGEAEKARQELIRKLISHGVAVPNFPPPSSVDLLRMADEKGMADDLDPVQKTDLGKFRDDYQLTINKLSIKESGFSRSRDSINELKVQKTKIEAESLAHSQSYGDRSKVFDTGDQLRFFFRDGAAGSQGIIITLYEFLFGEVRSEGDKQPYYLFVTMPSEVLVMLVVIAMGTMGSMISITQVFFAGEDRPITFYMFRPLLGAVVAIGVYVLTKAGVIVASNTSQQISGGTQLNAFFVSFVSLVAGLMSDSAINMMRTAGASFMRGDPVTETARYASRVQELIDADDTKTTEKLYAFFSYPRTTIDAWLAQKETVPGDAQRVIAAWLGHQVREVFSDIPPKDIERDSV